MRHLFAQLIEQLDVEVEARGPGDGWQMERRVGRAAEREVYDYCIFEGFAGEDIARANVFSTRFMIALPASLARRSRSA